MKIHDEVRYNGKKGTIIAISTDNEHCDIRQDNSVIVFNAPLTQVHWIRTVEMKPPVLTEQPIPFNPADKVHLLLSHETLVERLNVAKKIITEFIIITEAPAGFLDMEVSLHSIIKQAKEFLNHGNV